MGVNLTVKLCLWQRKGVILTVDKKILPKIQLKTKLTKTHPIFVKNTVAVLLLVVKVAAPPLEVCPKTRTCGCIGAKKSFLHKNWMFQSIFGFSSSSPMVKSAWKTLLFTFHLLASLSCPGLLDLTLECHGQQPRPYEVIEPSTL